MTSPASLSPSALNRFLGCEHRTYLDILKRRGELDEKRRPPNMELLFERGNLHEDGVVEAMVAGGRDLVRLDEDGSTRAERAASTLEAMRAGREILHQGCFLDGDWVGYPDILIRVEEPSELGAWSYEVHDAKLGSHPQPRHIFQLLFYDQQLTRLQGRRPARMHLLLGDDTHPSFTAEDFAARVREQFEARHAELSAPGAEPAYPYPVGDCEFCPWWHVCTKRRRDDDHLSLVAGLQKGQGLKLEAGDTATMPALASLSDEVKVDGLNASTLATLRHQADLQVRSRGLDAPLYALLEPAHDRGLARLPEPSAGDVHFDFEGDQYWGEEGLEYLFGSVYDDGDGPDYRPLWAFSRAEEKVAFEHWMDWITARLEQHPDLHVFHYNSYETVALKSLVARHGTREHELDELLRRKVFVDLYGITRQALQAGVEGYGLKPMEAVHGFKRAVPLGSMKRWQNYQADGQQVHLDGLAGYNREDCESTFAFYAWLLARRPEAEAEFGIALSSLEPEPAKEPSEAELERRAREEALRARLLAGLPDEEAEDDEHQRALRVTADLITYHRQEAKPAWWEFFDRRLRSLDQLRDEDRDAIGDLSVLSCEQDKRSLVWTLTYPTQEHKLGLGDLDEPLAECGVKLVALDEAERRVVVRCGPKFGTEPPRALAPGTPYRTPEQQAALFRFVERVADVGLGPCGTLDAGADLLTRRAPRFVSGTPPLSADAFDLDRLKAQVLGLDHTALIVQGPPGTGKTHNGARAALHLIDQGLKVGVKATSHKAINNLVEAIGEAADEARTSFVGWKKCGDKEHGCACGHVISSDSRPDGELDLIAATAWYWSREEHHEAVDVLFVDEAGQVSLADAIAVSQAAKSVVLLGGPQQLAHVSQGTHAHGSGVSVLQHLLGDTDTVPPDRGVFLPTSWRMHPAITAFISDTMYEGRVTSVSGCEGQHVTSAGLSGSGLRMLEVDHADNRGSSIEEAEAIAAEVALLLSDGRHVDRDGIEKSLTLEDILIVAPYNAQVRCLRAKLPDGARVGTVDKFQGQEAPIVFFSMASSSGDDVSRGMSFLFSRNRLNVAVSRAQCLAVVVCSPRLLGARCSSVEDMRLVNMLCRFAEAAGSAATGGNDAWSCSISGTHAN